MVRGSVNFCRTYEKPITIGMDALKQLISGIDSKDSAYDCIVPLSGGRGQHLCPVRGKGDAQAPRFLRSTTIRSSGPTRPSSTCERRAKILGIETTFDPIEKGTSHRKIVKHNMLCSDLDESAGRFAGRVRTDTGAWFSVPRPSTRCR